jgi:UPF0716 protein FxsA
MVLLVAAILAWPFLEIAAFVAVGREIGIFGTLALTIATSALGAVLLRIQGVASLRRIRRAIVAGGEPVQAIGHTALIALGGLLLLLPGFVSDILGLLLFVPLVRKALIAWIGRNARVTVVSTGRGGRRVVDLDPDEWRRRDDPEADPAVPRRPGELPPPGA